MSMLPPRPRRIEIECSDLADDAEDWLLDTLSTLIHGCPWLPDTMIAATPGDWELLAGDQP